MFFLNTKYLILNKNSNSKNLFSSPLSGSNSLNLHLEISFLKKSRACENFKIFCPSFQIIVALHLTLKQVNFFRTIFLDANLKSQFELWDVSKKKKKKVNTIYEVLFPIKMISSPNFLILGWCPVRSSYFLWRRDLFSLG